MNGSVAWTFKSYTQMCLAIPDFKEAGGGDGPRELLAGQLCAAVQVDEL